MGRSLRDPLRTPGKGVGTQPQAGAWGWGLAGSGARESPPTSVSSDCWMIPPSSADETESRRGVRGEGVVGLIRSGTRSPIPTQVLHRTSPPPAPPPHPAAVSQRPAAPPRPTSSSPSLGGRGGGGGNEGGGAPPHPSPSSEGGVHPLVELHKRAEERDVGGGPKVGFKVENLNLYLTRGSFSPPTLSIM